MCSTGYNEADIFSFYSDGINTFSGYHGQFVDITVP